ncbi:MAG: nucleotidyltransferase domain-containing protein [Chloroflexota bacterium]
MLAQLREITARIRQERREVEEIRAFGSLARGDATGVSDVDVLILLRSASESDPLQRIRAFLPYFDLDRGTDLLVYTRAEFEQQLVLQNRFLQKIWRESIPL